MTSQVTIYHEAFLDLHIILGFPALDRLKSFTNHPVIRTAFQEFIQDHLTGKKGAIEFMDEQGWFAVSCRMPSIPVYQYTWPKQDKHGWGYEQHVARFVFQANYHAGRSILCWQQRNHDLDSYERWAWQLFAMLLFLCREWLENEIKTGETENVLDTTDSDDGREAGDEDFLLPVKFADDKDAEENEDILLAVRDLLAECEQESSLDDHDVPLKQNGELKDEPTLDETSLTRGNSQTGETSPLKRRGVVFKVSPRRPVDEQPDISEQVPTMAEQFSTDVTSSSAQDTAWNQTGLIIGEDYPLRNTSTLKRSNAITTATSRSKRMRVSIERVVSESHSGLWTSCSLPWRRAGPGKWPAMGEFGRFT